MFAVLLILQFATVFNSAHANEPIRLIVARNLKGDRIGRKHRVPHALPNVPIWSELDPELNHFEGTSTQKVYAYYKIPKRKNPVIVAVIDSGVDIHHEDLFGKIWINPKIDEEYPGDVNGWSFIGSLDGSSLECTRELVRLRQKEKDGMTLTENEIAYRERLMEDYSDRRVETEETIAAYKEYALAFNRVKLNGGDSITLQNAKGTVQYLIQHDIDSKTVDEILEQKKKELKFAFNLDFEIPPTSGNNDVIGPNPEHGTHVAGIIAASRLNGFGIDGQAQNVRIMPLRVVPDGDERDEDVARAIRFAVDHGARIINMSFGKAFSPQKEEVDKAVQYAERHEVLIVHSAGNDGRNTDSFTSQFPNKKMSVGPEIFASNWIEVGASNLHAEINTTTGDSLAARFSNFGKISVDLFAPGVQIVSTVPGDQYESLQGTSMAAPQVSGIAAILLELHPNLTAKDLKTILMSTVTRYPGLKVIQPGTLVRTSTPDAQPKYDGNRVLFSDLSVSGGIVNAFNAVSSINWRAKWETKLINLSH